MAREGEALVLDGSFGSCSIMLNLHILYTSKRIIWKLKLIRAKISSYTNMKIDKPSIYLGFQPMVFKGEEQL
jgi:hypothetical protein